MKQIKYDNDEQLESIKRRALILKPNLPNVIATSMGWSRPGPFGGMELLVSFADLDSILGIETEVIESEPLVINVQEVELDDDEDLPPPNTLAANIISAPVAKVDDTVLDKPDLQSFLNTINSEDEEEPIEEIKVEEKPKKKGGRPKKAE